MIKLAIDARFYGLEHTGLGRYTTNVLRYLPTHLRGVSVQVLLRQKYYDTLELPANCEKVLAEIPHYSLAEQLVLPGKIDALGADLLYALHFNVPLFVKTPYVVTIHDLIKSHFTGTETTTRAPWLYHLKRHGYLKVIENAVKRSQSIIVPSNTVKNQILAAYDSDPTRIVVVPEAPDQVFQSSPKLSPLPVTLPSRYLLYVGNAYPHKNLSVLMDALEQLPDRELVMVAGSSPFLERILGKASDSVKKRITLISAVDDADLPAIYRHADALVTPSLMEGYGLPGIEALAVGTPVVASAIPVYREVYGTRAEFFDPTDVSDLVRAIRNINNNKRQPYDAGRTWDDVAAQIAEVINENCSRL